MLWTTPLFLVTFLKALSSGPGWRTFWGRVADRIAESWILCNNLGIRLTKPTRWEFPQLEYANNQGRYLVIANHQSWMDIVVLQRIFSGRLPFLKFFLKKELIWVPLLGQAWWALDFPFMKRYSRRHLEKHPEDRGRDLEVTRKACEKWGRRPLAVMNFVEGTRFTSDKAARQDSPYANLLKPKAAGIAFVLGALGRNLTGIIDVTITYPDGRAGLWDFLCGRLKTIRVTARNIPVTPELQGDYFGDSDFRAVFQDWLNDLWSGKDKLIEDMLANEPVPA